MLSRALYSIGWYLATPLVVAYLLWRSWRQPEYRRHWAERWGFVPRAAGPLVWVHAVSVGETRAAQPLVDALRERFPDVRILLTCMTPTGRDTARRLFGSTVDQSYLPYDYPSAVRRFLRRARPRLGILIETELWPNLVAVARAESVPVAMVNVRLSESSLRKGQAWSKLLGPALAQLSLVCAQSPGDAARIALLGRRADVVTGNLKFDILPPPDPVSVGRSLRVALAGRPVVLVASSREGEEALLLQAWQAREGTGAARPLLIVVPRHPQRFDEVAALVQRCGLRVSRRSEWPVLDRPPPDLAACDVILGDSMGELFAWYACADVAIIGGSLLPFGAQNLIEACAVGVPVLLGPHTYNFAQAAEEAVAAGAALRVTDAAQALAATAELLADGERRRRMSDAAHAFAAAHRGATQRTMQALGPLLARLL